MIEITQETMWNLIEKLDLSHEINKEKAYQLFQELDTDKTGYIKKSKFVEYTNTTLPKDKAIRNFYEIFNQHLYGKSERIILKLQNLRGKSYLNEDKDAIKDIDWYIIN